MRLSLGGQSLCPNLAPVDWSVKWLPDLAKVTHVVAVLLSAGLTWALAKCIAARLHPWPVCIQSMLNQRSLRLLPSEGHPACPPSCALSSSRQLRWLTRTAGSLGQILFWVLAVVTELFILDYLLIRYIVIGLVGETGAGPVEGPPAWLVNLACQFSEFLRITFRGLLGSSSQWCFTVSAGRTWRGARSRPGRTVLRLWYNFLLGFPNIASGVRY